MTSSPRVRFGLFLSGWLEPAAPTAPQVERLVDRIALAESYGFGSVWVGQHVLAAPRPVLDTDVFLGRLSGSTSTMEIGGVYLLPLAHPVRLAESLMSLDNISGGRFIPCGAMGWAAHEFAALGVPLKERVKRFEESIGMLRKLWAGDGPVDLDGRFFEPGRVHLTARAQRPGGMELWMGASSEAGIRRVARLGDAWLGSSHTPLADLRTFAGYYEQELAAAGKSARRRPLLRHCMVADTDPTAAARFVDGFERYYRELGSWGIFRDVVGERHAPGQDAGTGLPGGRAVVGSPDSALQQIEEYRALGFDEFIFQVGLPGTPEDVVLDSLRLLGEEVLPRLNSVGVP